MRRNVGEGSWVDLVEAPVDKGKDSDGQHDQEEGTNQERVVSAIPSGLCDLAGDEVGQEMVEIEGWYRSGLRLE